MKFRSNTHTLKHAYIIKRSTSAFFTKHNFLIGLFYKYICWEHSRANCIKIYFLYLIRYRQPATKVKKESKKSIFQISLVTFKERKNSDATLEKEVSKKGGFQLKKDIAENLLTCEISENKF